MELSVIGATGRTGIRVLGAAVKPGNVAYTVTGPREYTYHEVAEILSRITDERVSYEPARLIPFLRYHLARGKKPGHEPTTLEAFVLEHRELFLPDS